MIASTLSNKRVTNVVRDRYSLEDEELEDVNTQARLHLMPAIYVRQIHSPYHGLPMDRLWVIWFCCMTT